ncbi:hypothetical protein BDN71DRAFT_1453324, partial [Pleurotus eryngii]
KDAFGGRRTCTTTTPTCSVIPLFCLLLREFLTLYDHIHVPIHVQSTTSSQSTTSNSQLLHHIL